MSNILKFYCARMDCMDWFHHPYTTSFCLSKFSKISQFLNQYQACLYIFQCISHGDTKYSHHVVNILKLLNILCNCYCRLLTPAAWKGLRKIAHKSEENKNKLLPVVYTYMGIFCESSLTLTPPNTTGSYTE